jgi:hypothetical protein
VKSRSFKPLYRDLERDGVMAEAVFLFLVGLQRKVDRCDCAQEPEIQADVEREFRFTEPHLSLRGLSRT